jgi:hypothetical protein
VESTTQDDDFQEVKRRKRHISNDTSQTAKKPTKPVPTSAAVKLPRKSVLTRNFFASLRTNDLDMNTNGAEKSVPEQEDPRKPGRPPPIVMTSTTNLIGVQKDLKGQVKGQYTKGIRIMTKEIADYSAMKSYQEKNNLHYFTYSPNSKKPIKEVIHHLPPDTPAGGISNGLEDSGFSVINVKQMTVTRRAPNEQTHVTLLSLVLVTLSRNIKSQEIFKLNSLSHIIIKVELYRTHTGLMQSYNCQKFGHVWAKSKQPSRCLWCRGCHLHREFPAKTNAESTPSCCNCTLGEGEKPHPASYRGCSHAKENFKEEGHNELV